MNDERLKEIITNSIISNSQQISDLIYQSIKDGEKKKIEKSSILVKSNNLETADKIIYYLKKNDYGHSKSDPLFEYCPSTQGITLYMYRNGEVLEYSEFGKSDNNSDSYKVYKDTNLVGYFCETNIFKIYKRSGYLLFREYISDNLERGYYYGTDIEIPKDLIYYSVIDIEGKVVPFELYDDYNDDDAVGNIDRRLKVTHKRF